MRYLKGLKKVGILVLIVFLIWTGVPSIGAVGNELVSINEDEFDTSQDITFNEEKGEIGDHEEQGDVDGRVKPEDELEETPMVNELEEKQDTTENDKVDSVKPAHLKKQAMNDEQFGVQEASGDFEYEENDDGTATITGYSGNETDISIPTELNGLIVSHIGKSAFNEKKLTSVEIPNGVLSIGDWAFQDNALKSVEIPDGVTNIGIQAFNNNQLKKVTIPKSVKSIKMAAFQNNELIEVTIPDGVTSIELQTFNGNQLTEVSIPDSVTSIGFRAFSLNKLTRIDIPDSVTNIGANAFQSNQLTEISIPNSVTSIGLEAFYNNQLTEVSIPDSVTNIGEKAFGLNKLTSVTIYNDSVTIGNNAFMFNSADLTIYGYNGTSVETYAHTNSHIFSGVNPVQVTFAPNGREAGDTDASTAVGIENVKPEEPILYTWSKSEQTPDGGWEDLDEEGLELRISNHVEGYYLHIRTVGLLGNTVDIRSEIFHSLFVDGDGSEDNPYIIETAEQLDAIRYELNAHYELGNDIDLSGYENWEPIGSCLRTNFTGALDGNGYTITNLTIEQSIWYYVGLFGCTEGAMLSHIHLENVNIVSDGFVGGLVGSATRGTTIKKSYTTGKVSGTRGVGGLAGAGMSATIKESYATGEVSGENILGGLVGYAKDNNIEIENAYWDTDSTGQESSAGGKGLTTAQMLQQDSFENWNFAETWFILNDQTYPVFIGDNRQDPVLSLESVDPIQVSVGQETEIELNGMISHLLEGDTAYLKYTIRNEAGEPLSDYKYQTMKNYSVEDTTLDFAETLSIDDGIEAGMYMVDVYAKALDAKGTSEAHSITLYVFEIPVFAGGDGTDGNPYIIETANQLDAVRHELDAHYQLGADIDVSEYSVDGGWGPIGDENNYFIGSLDGAGYAISNLTIHREGDYQGLFGVVGTGGIIENTSLINVQIDATSNSKNIGGLAGENRGTIADSSVKDGEIRGYWFVGGLVGNNLATLESGVAEIRNSYATVDVTGRNYIGGLVGQNYASVDGLTTKITDSYATGEVSGTGSHVGGLVGYNRSHAGGVVEIRSSYATGKVQAWDSVGGLVGGNFVGLNSTNKITNSYATGATSGTDNIGGLIGLNGNFNNDYGIIEITNTYATGVISGTNNVGGLIGDNLFRYDGTTKVIHSYWDKESTNQENSADGEGKISEEMKQRDTYENWDFDNIWYQYEEETLPFFKWQDTFDSWDVQMDKDSLTIGEETEISVIAKHQGESVYHATATAAYVVEPEDIVTIKNGKVTAEKVGKATITVSLHGESKALDVSVIPDKPIVDETPEIVNTDTIKIEGTGQAGATIEITGGSENISGETNTNGDFAIEVPLNKNTENILQVTVSIEGLVSNPVEITILHDGASPESPTIMVDPEGWTNADEVHVTIDQKEKDEGLSEVTTIRVKVRDEDWADYRYEDVLINWRVEIEGETKIKAQAIDGIGNESEIAEAVVQIDRTAPTVNFGTNGSNAVSKKASTNVTVEDKASGLDEDSLEYVWSTSSDTPPDVDWESFASGDDLEKQGENGKWYLHIRATDIAGNTVNASSKAFHLDNTVPRIEIIMTQGENFEEYAEEWTNEFVNFSVAMIDENKRALEIKINDKQVDVEDINDFSYQKDFTEDGTYHIQIKATDFASHISKKETTIQIDRTAPTVIFGTNGSNAVSKEASTNVTVEDKASGLDEDSLEYVWSTSSDTPPDADWKFFASGDDLEKQGGNGKWYLHIRATDIAGNAVNASSEAFHLDNTSPEIDVTMKHGDENYHNDTWTNQTVNVSVKAIDKHSEIDSLQILVDGAEESKPEFSLNESGIYELSITAIDQAGNETTEERTIKISKDGLTFEMALEQADGTAYESGFWTTQNVIASMESHNSEGVEVTKEYSLDNGESWKEYKESIILSEGTHSIWFQAKDEAGNTLREEINIYIDQTAPKLSLLGDKVINLFYGEEFDDPGYLVEDNLATALAVEVTGEVDHLQVGLYEIIYYVKDHAGNETTMTRTVNINDEELPVITLEGDNPLIMEVGTVYEEPGATAKDNVDGDISGKVEISGAVDVNKIGIYEIRYKVSDQAGNKAFEAVREVHVVAPEVIWLELDKQAVPVYAGSLVKIKDTNANIQLPEDLPEGTTLKVESVDISVEGYEQAGEVLNFIFTYPDGEEEYVGNFGLTLGVDKDAENVAIYHYNENHETLELIGGERENGLIITAVNQLSTYGVFSHVKEEEIEKIVPPKEAKEKVTPPKEEKVEELTHPNGEKQDGLLPNTATNIYNWLLLGLVLMVVGTVVLQVNRRKIE